MQGTVKWFNDEKGYGFIKKDDGAEVFVHWSSILNMRGRKNLMENQRVEFEEETGPKGLQAKNVNVITN